MCGADGCAIQTRHQAARAQAAFESSKTKVLDLEGRKKDAEEKIGELKKQHEDLVNPELDDEDVGGMGI